MKFKWNPPAAGKVLQYFKEYKLVLLVIAAGIFILLWPSGEKSEKTDGQAAAGLTGGEEDFSVEALEEKLNETLSKVEGAGHVTVVLTVKQGMERVLAADEKITDSDSQRSKESETVIISTGGGDEAVLITQHYPVFQGALVVCEGGDDPQVRLLLTQAVAALTGLGSDRITICKGG